MPSGADAPPFRHRARCALSRLMAWALRQRSRPYAGDPGAPLLVFAPHQDDETLGCAGLIAGQRRAGRPVSIVYLTDGSGSHPGHPRVRAEEIARRRHAEAVVATGLLGVAPANLHFLGARDGTLNRLEPDAAAALATGLCAVLAAVRPSEILLPARRDGSSEHEAAFLLIGAAVAQTGLQPRVLEYPVWAWWNPRRLLRPLFTSRRVWRVSAPENGPLKRRALAAYATQFEPLAPWNQPVMAPQFADFFLSPEEFFFEMDPVSAPRP
jgi:LmbE family N-acetylglucosaminyl deacetylase